MVGANHPANLPFGFAVRKAAAHQACPLFAGVHAEPLCQPVVPDAIRPSGAV